MAAQRSEMAGKAHELQPRATHRIRRVADQGKVAAEGTLGDAHGARHVQVHPPKRETPPPERHHQNNMINGPLKAIPC